MFRKAQFLIFPLLLSTGPLLGTVVDKAVAPAEEALPADTKAVATEKKEEPTVRRVRFKKNKVAINKREDIILSANVQAKIQKFRETLEGERPVDPVIEPSIPFLPIVTRNEAWEIEANLWVDHRGECNWAEINLRFKNFAGKNTGTLNKLTLERAFIGYQFWDCPERSRFQVEMGRMKIGDRFQSAVQYGSLFDGLLFGYGTPLRGFCDLYLQLGAFVIDFRTNYFSFIGEAEFSEILKTGWYFKYSYITWARRTSFRFILPILQFLEFSFRDSQWILGYKFPKERFCRPVQINGGFVWNHAAERDPAFAGFLGNTAWWVVIEIGSLVKRCDWLFKFGYQYVGLLSIFEGDVSGIGRGNRSDSSIFSLGLSPALRRGNTNYKGFTTSFAFALTDALSVQASYEASNQINDLIGGINVYSKAEFKSTYVF